jgi:glucose/mannose-6-phosphate isomerase
MDASTLDSREAVERLDPQGLLGRLDMLPDQCAEAWQAAASIELPAGSGDARQTVVLGMGGSAIAGDVFRALSALSGAMPVHVVRGYDLPAFVDGSTFVIACSHSGNTEETLSAVEQALAAGAKVFALTTGGRLRALADERGLPSFGYQYQGEPRSAIGHQLMALLAMGERVGLLDAQEASVAEAVSLLRDRREALHAGVPLERNPAKQLAVRLHGRLAVVIGAGILEVAAYRWKTQMNENGKSWAVHEVLPELDHNSIAGFGLPAEVVPLLRVVFLSHAALHSRVLLRYEATAQALSDAGVAHERVEAKGAVPLAQVLTAIYMGDYTSYYLALLNEVEPSPVPALDKMKAWLAERA